jgi:hypothetical protein
MKVMIGVFHLHELLRLRLDPLAAVDHHQRAVHGGEDPVGVLRKVLVAGGVEEVDLEGVVVELHDRRRDGDPPLLFDRHPVAHRVPSGLPRLDGAGKLDRPAEEEEFFGERRLSRVGVADDAEGPALIDLLFPSSIRLDDGRWSLRGAPGLNTHNHFLFRFHDEKKSPTAVPAPGTETSKNRLSSTASGDICQAF